MYFRPVIIILSIAFLNASCRPKTDENDAPPTYILSEEMFLKVLTDSYLGEGAAGVNVKNVTGERYDSAYIFNPFQDNGITKAQFDTTVLYYSQHPLKLKEIYSRLLDNLSRIQVFGTLGNTNRAEIDKYKFQDLNFYYTVSKIDSVKNSTKLLGYNLKPFYGFTK